MTQPDTQTPPDDDPTTGTQSDEGKTFTQADVDRLIADRLKRAKPADYDEARKKAAEFDKLQEASQTEQERAAKAAAETEKRAEQAEARAIRLEVAFDKGLTPAQAKRLVGGTREELEADADEILVDFPVKTDGRPKGDADLGTRTSTATATPMQADLAQIEADLRASKRK